LLIDSENLHLLRKTEQLLHRAAHPLCLFLPLPLLLPLSLRLLPLREAMCALAILFGI
jgi:hypothetical protein